MGRGADRARKPKRCPSCGHEPVASILYGMPAMNEDTRERLLSGRLVLAGCTVTDDDPAWECGACGLRMWRDGRTVGTRSEAL